MRSNIRETLRLALAIAIYNRYWDRTQRVLATIYISIIVETGLKGIDLHIIEHSDRQPRNYTPDQCPLILVGNYTTVCLLPKLAWDSTTEVWDMMTGIRMVALEENRLIKLRAENLSLQGILRDCV